MKKDIKKDFIPLSVLFEKKMKSKKFREGFSRVIAQQLLAYELKALRTKKKMTQREVATKAKMPQSVIARIESGNHSASLATLWQIAGVFHKHIGFVNPSKR